MKAEITPNQVKIEASWKAVLQEEFSKAYFADIKGKLLEDRKAGKVIFPPGRLIFNAFNTTPYDDVKVVIIGQDPYHNPGEAMGLCFSVPKDKKVPPSLKRIYKEIHNDIGAPIPDHGDLTSWASQGVLMLNAILTVEKNRAASHRKYGWQQFTDAVIRILSQEKDHLVFLLWGNFAKGKAELIDNTKHLILTSAHPSPLAGNAFFDNHHFSRCNAYLTEHDKQPIDWRLK